MFRPILQFFINTNRQRSGLSLNTRESETKEKRLHWPLQRSGAFEFWHEQYAMLFNMFSYPCFCCLILWIKITTCDLHIRVWKICYIGTFEGICRTWSLKKFAMQESLKEFITYSSLKEIVTQANLNEFVIRQVWRNLFDSQIWRNLL